MHRRNETQFRQQQAIELEQAQSRERGHFLACSSPADIFRAGSYMVDLLSFQDAKLQGQSNARRGRPAPGCSCCAASYHAPIYGCRSLYLSLTGLHSKEHFRRRAMDHPSHHRSRVDKRTACVEAGPPCWLTSQPIGGLRNINKRQQYEMVLEEYWKTYADEELRRNGLTREAGLQHTAWHSGSYRFFEIVSVPEGIHNLFDGHIRPCSTSASRKCPSLTSSPISTGSCNRRALQRGSGKSGRHTSLS